MVKNGKLKIKEVITSVDISNVVNAAVEFIIRKDDDDMVMYTPYYKADGLLFGVIAYLVEGIEIEPDEVLDAYSEDEELHNIAKSFFSDEHLDEWKTIDRYIDDIVAFRKEEYLYSRVNEALINAAKKESALNDMLFKLAETQNRMLAQEVRVGAKQEEILSQMDTAEIAEINKMMVSGKYDIDDIIQKTIQQYMKTQGDKDGIQ